MAKILQLLRSNKVYTDKAAAVAALGDSNFLNGRKDGEIVLARYYYTYTDETTHQNVTVAKSIMGVYHVEVPLGGEAGTTKTGVTILEDNSAIDDVLAGLDYNLEADDNKVVTDVNQENGRVSAASKNLTAIKLAGYAEGTNADIADTDTLGQALGKLQAQINAMDKAASAVDGKVVTTIAEDDGKVSETKANVKDLQLGGYAKDADATGEIGSTDTINTALSKIENKIAANTVSSTDGSITIDTEGATTDLSVTIDGTTIQKANGGALKSGLTVIKEIDNLETNVKEQYKLAYKVGDAAAVAISGAETIKIYKDSSLKEVYLGAGTDTVDTTTGAVTKYAYELISDPSTQITAAEYAELTEEQKALYQAIDSQSMNFVYQLADGTYSITKIDVSKFLTESEFSDGLQVSNAVVSVKKDDTSGKVRTAAQPAEGEDTGLVDVLTISSAGVKIANIQEAINYAISTLDTADAAVAGQYISQVAETDGKLTISRANVSDAILTGYAKGSKPVSTAVAATDDVKGAIAKLEHQVDDAKAAATTVVKEGTDAGNNMSIDVETDSTDNHKTYTINLTDVASATALSNEITRAGNAETAIDSVVGLTKDANNETRTYTNTGTYIGKGTTNTVKSDIKALDTEVADGLNSVTGSNAITVGTKSNKDQTISLKLDYTTAATNQTLTGTNALQITSDGLFLSSTWDCGTFGNNQ